MATESPMRMVESSGVRKWPSSDPAKLASPAKNMAAEELGVLLCGHSRLPGNGTSVSPSRSGSAPPSMEGSVAALGNLLAKQNVNLDHSLASLSNAIKTCESEEQLRSDPAYISYYYSRVNLNPRLPPPLISRENRHLVNHVGGIGNNHRLTSLDDGGQKSLHLSGGSLFTHTEEPEDNKAPLVSDRVGGVTTYSEQEMVSSSGRHKSLVDLIQEDFPRTPSPVFQSRSSSHGEESIDRDVHAISLNISSIDISKVSESSLGSVNESTEACPVDSHVIGLMSAGDLSQSFPGLSSTIGKLTIPKDDDYGNKEVELEHEASMAGLDAPTTNENNVRRISGRSVPLHNSSAQHLHQSAVVQGQVIFQGTNPSQGRVEKFPPGYLKSSVEGQSAMHSPGLAPPLYATAATYMGSNTFYPNLQPTNLFAPQYGLGGYPMGSAIIPPYMAAYHPHSAFPVPFDATSGPSFSGRSPVGSVSNGQGVAGLGDLQHVGKIYGQHAVAYQPSFVDPIHVPPYFQHPYDDGYGASTSFGRVARGGFGAHMNSFSSQNELSVTHHMGDQKLQFPANGSMGIPNLRKGNIIGSNYYGSSPSIGIMSQFPGSPLASPVMPSSPVGSMNHIARRNDMRFTQGSPRNGGMYSPFQSPRGISSFEDPKRNSFIEELKSNNSRKFELSDIAGRIVEFSVDQHGSRFIQQKLENCTVDEKEAVFREVLPHASKLMTDVFGNYVIQKFFEHGSADQRKELANQLIGQMLPLSLQMYGCRVIQKALDVIELDQKTQLVLELDGNVMRCVRDQNGNHVIQKCIECLPTERIGFIISSFRSQVATLSTHPYGCRVIQRVLEHCSDELQSQCIVDEILESACLLAEDQYGNYVTQHVLERGKPQERAEIISKLTGKVVQMSQHKYASNVVEKCLEHGDAAERELLIGEIIGQSEENDSLLAMMKDQFANYVVQKILEVSSDKHREILLQHIKVHLHALKKYTYGKHIVARFEQLTGEGDSCDTLNGTETQSVEANSI